MKRNSFRFFIYLISVELISSARAAIELRWTLWWLGGNGGVAAECEIEWNNLKTRSKLIEFS